MKLGMIIGMLVIGAWLPARAGVYYAGQVTGSSYSALNQTITAVGTPSSINVSGEVAALSTVAVTINVSGGFNGGLYAYLSYNGTMVQLLNQVGTGEGDEVQQVFGFSTSGFNNITLADGSAQNIHDVQNPMTGTSYSPDGGTLDAASPAGFGGMNPNGTWTIYFADLGSGSPSTLEGWSLDITAVPEPVNVALAIFGGLLAVWSVARRRMFTSASAAR